MPININIVMAWKSKGSWNESIKFLATSNNSLNPRLDFFINPKFWLEFDGSCLRPDKVTFVIKRQICIYFLK